MIKNGLEAVFYHAAIKLVFPINKNSGLYINP